jgi:exodeoxyribonuclease-5
MARKGQRIPVGDYGDGVVVKMLDRETQSDVYRPETQTICGVHRVRWTVTQRLRGRLGFQGPLPMAGERVMCCRNANELGIFNGQVGTMLKSAEEIEPGGAMLFDVELEDRSGALEELPVHPYHFQQHFLGPLARPRIRREVHEFDWGYVLTAHKAQGSEWPHVTVIDDSASFRNDRDRWLYTALTRPSEGLTLLKRAA